MTRVIKKYMQTDNQSLWPGEEQMRIALGKVRQPTERRLRFAKQLGLGDVILDFGAAPHMLSLYKFYKQKRVEDPPVVVDDHDDLGAKLQSVREDIEAAGLRLAAIEGLPGCSIDAIIFDRSEKDEQLARVKKTIRMVGDAGVPIIAYSWSPTGVIRTSVSERIRGDAKATVFNATDFDGMPSLDGAPVTEPELWNRYEAFLTEVLPVAEEVGVKLALHPNDPPMEEIGGVPCLHRHFENFRRTMDLVPSDNHGLVLGLGTWSEMGEDLHDAIQYFGDRDEIFFVHFRDVKGTVPSFHETFVDEGNFDTYEILETLDEVEFTGPIMSDHVPQMEGDSDYGHQGRAFTVGYLKSSLAAIEGR